MRRILDDRGVQAACGAAVTLALLTVVSAERFPAAWIGLWVAWALVTTVATVHAARRAR